MVEHTESQLADWADGEVVDVQLEVARLTVKIIVSAMFGADITDEEVKTVQEKLEPLGARFEPDPRRFLIPNWMPTRENREFDAAIGTLESVIDGIVDRRRGTEYDPSVDPAGQGGRRGARPRGDGPDGDGAGDLPMDLLSVLLRARDRGEQTDENLRDELVTMLLAGHDTTALALTYTFYLLSRTTPRPERARGTGGRGGDRRRPADRRRRPRDEVHRARPQRITAIVPARLHPLPRAEARRETGGTGSPRAPRSCSHSGLSTARRGGTTTRRRSIRAAGNQNARASARDSPSSRSAAGRATASGRRSRCWRRS